MGNEPLVSVVIPVYNGEAFIARSIRSVLAQDWPALEIVVVDDGSSDGTRQVVEGIAPGESGERAIRYFRQTNSGASAARNRGIRESRGEFVAMLDADDEWLASRLRRTIEPILADASAGICYTRSLQVLADGRRLPMHADAVKHRRDFGIYPPQHCVTSSVSFRRSALDRAGYFDETMTQLEDIDLFIRVAEVSKSVEIPEPLVLQYDRPEGLHAQGNAERRADLILRVAFKALGRTRGVYDREGALAIAYQAAGIQYFDAGRRARALHCFLISLAFRATWRGAAFALRTLLPRSLGKAAKKMRDAE